MGPQVGGRSPLRPSNSPFRARRSASIRCTRDRDGRVTTDITTGYDAAWDIVIQPDDKVVAGGEASGAGGSFAAARYLEDGALDPGFDGDGIVAVNFTARADFAFGLARQPADGNLVLVGGSGWGGSNPRFAVARLLDE